MKNDIIQFFLKKIYSIKGFFKYLNLKKGKTYYNKLYNCPCVFLGKHNFRLIHQGIEPTYGVVYYDNTRTTAIKEFINIYLFIKDYN